MKTVKIKMDDLIDAFEHCSMEQKYFLNTETGEMDFIFEFSMLQEEIDEKYNEMDENPERFIEIPEKSPSDGYKEMEEFTEIVKDKHLQEILYTAISGKGAFRRFKDVLINYPQDREHWFKFRDERAKHEVRQWLKENKIKLSED